ncbi:MAG: hypothetical protein ABIT01_12645 [Thermoanaerobaculia bacterium]
MAQIRGFAIRGLLHHAKTKGLAASELIRQLSPEARASYTSQITHSEFYPYEAFTGLIHVLDQILGDGAGSSIKEIGRSAGKEDIKGIFQVVAFLASPEKAVHRSPSYWSRYCDTGTFVEEEIRPGYFRLALENFPDIDPLHCRLIEGWNEAGVSSSWGTRNVKVTQVECVSRGGKRCVFEGTWD